MSDNCEKYTEMIQQKMDGELSTSGEAELSRHLSSCDACRDDMEAIEHAVELFTAVEGSLEVPELSPDFAERVASRATAKTSRKINFTRLAAAVVLALAVGSMFGYLIKPGFIKGPDRGVKVESVTWRGDNIGVEIDNDSFVLHSRDKEGDKGIDLKF